jgi:hypothetical protein
MKAVAIADGKLVRVRDVTLVGIVLSVLGGVIHYWPVLTGAAWTRS